MAQKEIILVRGEHKSEIIHPEIYSNVVKSLRDRGYTIREVRSKLTSESVRRMKEIVSKLGKAGRARATPRQPEEERLVKEYRDLFRDGPGQETSARIAQENPKSLVFSLHTTNLPASWMRDTTEKLKQRIQDGSLSLLTHKDMNMSPALTYYELERNPVVFVTGRLGSEGYEEQPNLFYIEMRSPQKPILPPVYENPGIIGGASFRSDVKVVTPEQRGLLAKHIADQIHNIAQGKAKVTD